VVSEAAMKNQLPDYEQLEVYLNGEWVDISQYVRTNLQPLEAPAGRQTTLEEIQPSRLAAYLDDRDRRFTCGNPTSPYFPYWDQGAPIRWRTTIAGGTVGQFRGVLEMPQGVLAFAELDDDDDAGIYCSITAVDRLTQLDRAPAFITTLAAHILGQPAAEQLVGFWPMNEPTQLFASTKSTASQFAVRFPAAVEAAAVAGPPGDDGSYVGISTAGVDSNGTLVATLTGATVGSGDAVAASAWVRLNQDGPTFGIFTLAGGFSTVGAYAGGGGTVTGRAVCFDLADAIFTGNLGADVWYLVTVRFSLPSGVVSLWINDTVSTATMAAPGASMDITTLYIADQFGANAAYSSMQVYVGAEADVFNHADHLAQWQHGLRGLERQTVDERIRTVAGYAGVSDAELDLERSPTVMPVARLAGQRPGAALRTAALADTGPLFTNGDGEIVFQSRTHRYNV
jgi:hypothetical protein